MGVREGEKEERKGSEGGRENIIIHGHKFCEENNRSLR